MSVSAAPTEGTATAPALAELAARLALDLPICQAVADLLAGRLDLRGAITALLSRPRRDE
jgi:glycerol-3-phosphate dehydrogenase (NAD(P)+)